MRSDLFKITWKENSSERVEHLVAKNFMFLEQLDGFVITNLISIEKITLNPDGYIYTEPSKLGA